MAGPWGSCSQRVTKGEYPDDYCYKMSAEEMLRFDEYKFLFSGGPTLVLGPRQYVYELRTGVWCMGIFNNGHSGTVIGAATMRNHEVPSPQAPPPQSSPPRHPRPFLPPRPPPPHSHRLEAPLPPSPSPSPLH